MVIKSKPDLRCEVRYEIPCVIVKLEEQTSLRTNVIYGNIIDISRSGVRVSTSEKLKTRVQYKLETKFLVGRIMKLFSSIFIVRFCIKSGYVYFSGGVFDKPSMLSEDKKILSEFLTEIKRKAPPLKTQE